METSVQSVQTNLNYSNESNEYIQTLIRENEQLKLLNEKIFKKSMNQKRKILRLKKQLSEYIPQTSVKLLDEDETNIWEDVEEVMASYNITKE
jgi:hypothetical protein